MTLFGPLGLGTAPLATVEPAAAQEAVEEALGEGIGYFDTAPLYGAGYDVPLKAAAMRFPATHPAVTTVLIGCATAAEVRENAALWRHPLPAELWTALK